MAMFSSNLNRMDITSVNWLHVSSINGFHHGISGSVSLCCLFETNFGSPACQMIVCPSFHAVNGCTFSNTTEKTSYIWVLWSKRKKWLSQRSHMLSMPTLLNNYACTGCVCAVFVWMLPHCTVTYSIAAHFFPERLSFLNFKPLKASRGEAGKRSSGRGWA